MSQHIELTGEFQDHQFGQRLDQALAELFPDYSRTRIKEWILQDRVTLDGQVANTPREKVLAGQKVHVDVELADDTRWDAQNIELNIVYEDEHILVIDKPAGLVVHPGAGTPDGTILNALLHRYPAIAEVPRAGIVHRLDKDTTGLMVVAKTIPAQTHLVEALQARQITREYEAIAIGHMTAGGTVDAPSAVTRPSVPTWPWCPMGASLSPTTGCTRSSVATPVCGCDWKPVVPTRSVSTWPTSSIRWWGIPLTVAVCVCCATPPPS